MKTVAYCCHSFSPSVLQAAGVHPLTCPPITRATFDPAWLSGARFVYFKLHGLPGERFWYGDHWLTAIDDEQLRQADLSRAVVFVASCHLDPGPMLEALLDAGARAVIGGSGPNYAKRFSLYGADIIGRTLRRLIRIGISPAAALAVAKARLSIAAGHDNQAADALAFRLFTQDRRSGWQPDSPPEKEPPDAA